MAASSCSTTRVDMAQHGALRDGVLRHRILRQVHAVPHRLDARRRGHRPHRARARIASANLALLEDLCDTMKFGSLCALGGITPYPVHERAQAFPGGFRPLTAQARSRLLNEERHMSTDPGNRSRHPGRRRPRTRSRSTIDGVTVTVPARHVDHARGDASRHRRSPSSAPPTCWKRSAPAGCAWSRSRAASGTPASCTTPVAEAWW